MYKDTHPIFSVVIPTYKRPGYLKRAIRSVLNQSMHNFEVIVVDDDKNASGAIIVDRFDDKRVKYVQNKRKSGPSIARNVGVENARSPYIAFLDDDDIWTQHTLKSYYNVIKNTRNTIHFMFSPVINTFENNKASSAQKSSAPEGMHYFLEGFLSLKFRALTSSLVIKTNSFWSVGGFDEDLTPGAEEWELCIRLAKKYKGYFLDKQLIRRTVVSGEHVGGGPMKKALGREAVIKKHYKLFRERRDILSRHYYMIGVLFIQAKNTRDAQKYFWKAWAQDKRRVGYALRFLASLPGFLFYDFLKNKTNKPLR